MTSEGRLSKLRESPSSISWWIFMWVLSLSLILPGAFRFTETDRPLTLLCLLVSALIGSEPCFARRALVSLLLLLKSLSA